MHPMLRATLCLTVLSFAPVARADGFGAHPVGPIYVPPGAVVQTPVAVVYGDDDGFAWRGWQRHAWHEFDEAAADRARENEERLGQERAVYLSQWGWDPARMAWFDHHQAEEREVFAQQEASRRAAFMQQLAFAGPEGWRGHGRWEHRHHHHHEDED